MARHYGRSPDRIGLEEVRDFLHYLIVEHKAAFSTVNQKLSGIRFFYRHVLGKADFPLRVPAKRSGRLPEPLSRSENRRLFEAAYNLKHRVLMMSARRLLGAQPPSDDQPQNLADWLREVLGLDLLRCPRCGQPLFCQTLPPLPSDDGSSAAAGVLGSCREFFTYWDTS